MFKTGITRSEYQIFRYRIIRCHQWIGVSLPLRSSSPVVRALIFLSGVLSLIALSLFFWSWCCLSFLDFRFLVAPLLSYQLDQKCAFHVPCTNRTFSLSLVHYQNAAGFWWLCCSGFGILCGVMSPIVVSFFLLAIVLSAHVRFRLLVAPLAIKPEMF